MFFGRAYRGFAHCSEIFAHWQHATVLGPAHLNLKLKNAGKERERSRTFRSTKLIFWEANSSITTTATARTARIKLAAAVRSLKEYSHRI
jgi:hypothetical protein